uniref:Mg-protoporyphyrin IX chelatase n=1 Tax=Galdieria phlegrea TaxID=1389228 RepID=UPI0023D83D38|nr:Mg-protoporyphyrin IX chelatase [Galdieria phlegrea]WDA99822.1 Mg-protoporyphyrin IX chelatase [Galdieria phlegrea]|eukprot:jgi/Galph1/4566/GphlegSOOS_G3224.1
MTINTNQERKKIFPFTAIIGQEEMKLALILNVIDPKIGGVMIMGDRGTGKSTTIRALADLLPEIEVVTGDIYNCSPDEIYKQDNEKNVNNSNLNISHIKIPMVELPLGATEDRVCGTIDIEKALFEGIKSFEPGLLAKANRGILYVDEVNLLDDHLVDILLDAAASGWNIVEREGISIKHPSNFVLVGSGNPEEGELRPQLLDRFGLHAEIKTVKDPLLRVKIVEERSLFEENYQNYIQSYQQEQEKIRQKIVKAQKNLSKVQISNSLQLKISELCSVLDIDGLRGDIVINRASKALASYEERYNVNINDLERICILCLRHRLKKDPLETIDSGKKIQQAFEKIFK